MMVLLVDICLPAQNTSGAPGLLAPTRQACSTCQRDSNAGLRLSSPAAAAVAQPPGRPHLLQVGCAAHEGHADVIRQKLNRQPQVIRVAGRQRPGPALRFDKTFGGLWLGKVWGEIKGVALQLWK